MNVFSESEARNLYELLVESVPWNDGVRTRQGKRSRAQCSLELTPDYVQESVMGFVERAFESVHGTVTVACSVYLNYYNNGNDFCPKHKHDETRQIIISLGGTRTMFINGIAHELTNGSVVAFGSEYHEIKRQPTSTGRISIAVFYRLVS
jgi:hypothetical protein